MRLNYKKKIVILTYMSMYIVINHIALLFSLIYLNYNNVYILEQRVVSYNNSSLLYYIPFLISYIIILLIGSKYLKIPQIRFNKQQNGVKYLIAFSIFILFLSYLNIFISGNIPLFSSGYISRFDYISTTKLWPVLKFFGQTVTIIPIILGYAYLSNSINNQSQNKLIFILILYLLYMLLIGQKFGGLIQGVYLFSIPIFIYNIVYDKFNYKKAIMYLFTTLIIVLFVVYYHYSNYYLAYQYGGPFKFILYRIFALQGHTFWGTVNYMHLNSDITFLYNGMQNLMKLIGPSDIYISINRGVNFTTGFQAALIMSFPYIIAILVSVILNSMYIKYINIIIKNISNISYLMFVYIFVKICTFFTMGSLRDIFDIKIMMLLYLVTIIKFMQIIGKKSIKYSQKVRYKIKN